VGVCVALHLVFQLKRHLVEVVKRVHHLAPQTLAAQNGLPVVVALDNGRLLAGVL
jgi:hypothetical protein